MTCQAKELLSNAGNNIQNLESIFKYSSWQDVPWTTQLKIFNYWFLWNAVGNVLQAVSSMAVLIVGLTRDQGQGEFLFDVSLGLTGLFTWIQLLQYFEHWSGVVLMHNVLHHAMTSIYIFFGLVLPIFVGFAVIAYAFFWKYDAFESLGDSMIILFAMSCGDAVHDTFHDVWDEGLQKQLLLVIFMVVFFTAATNILYALIQDGFDKNNIAMKIRDEQELPHLDSEEMKKIFTSQFDENRQHPRDFAPEVYELLESPDLGDSERSN